MSVFDRVKGLVGDELVEIIEWLDPSRNVLAYRFVDEDHEIKRGAQLVVRESQVAQFVLLGQFAECFQPGLHRLDTPNIPLITTLKGWKYGFESPFKAEVYFVSTRLFTGQKWGTQHPVLLRDADFGLVRAKGFGTFDVQVTAPPTFLRSIVGTNPAFTLDQFIETMRPRIVALFSETLAAAKLPIVDVATRYREVGQAVTPLMNEVCEREYGIRLANFLIENISVPTEVEQAIDKRAGIAALGNLDDYLKVQVANSLTVPGGSGVLKTGIELALGAQMAQQLAGSLGKKSE